MVGQNPGPGAPDAGAGAGGGAGAAATGNPVLNQPILIAFPVAFALTEGLQALLSTFWDQPIIWGLLAALVVSFLIYKWDEVSSGHSRWQYVALNTLILWLTSTGFISEDVLTSLTGG
jgi:hypothetical protein